MKCIQCSLLNLSVFIVQRPAQSWNRPGILQITKRFCGCSPDGWFLLPEG